MGSLVTAQRFIGCPAALRQAAGLPFALAVTGWIGQVAIC
jgi:hypothetical protein